MLGPSSLTLRHSLAQAVLPLSEHTPQSTLLKNLSFCCFTNSHAISGSHTLLGSFPFPPEASTHILLGSSLFSPEASTLTLLPLLLPCSTAPSEDLGELMSFQGPYESDWKGRGLRAGQRTRSGRDRALICGLQSSVPTEPPKFTCLGSRKQLRVEGDEIA